MSDLLTTAVSAVATTNPYTAVPLFMWKHRFLVTLAVLAGIVGGGWLWLDHKNAQYAKVTAELSSAQAANSESNKTIDKLNAAEALDRAVTAKVVAHQDTAAKAVSAAKKEQKNEVGAAVPAGAGWDALGDRLRSLSSNPNAD